MKLSVLTEKSWTGDVKNYAIETLPSKGSFFVNVCLVIENVLREK